MSAPRRTPWHDAPDDSKLSRTVGPYSTLIANLTPAGNKVRLGFMIEDREISIAVPFGRAADFFREVEMLIKKRGR